MSIFSDKSGLNGPGTWSEGTFPSSQENFPVTGISWYEANAYAKWAEKQLPTIYHWYKAAMYWGESSVISPRSNFKGSQSEVGKYDVLSSYGCFDMAGNVWEYVADYWHPKIYAQGMRTDPGGPADGEVRVLRGGGWYSYAADCRVAYRHGGNPDYRHYNRGFRLVLSQD